MWWDWPASREIACTILTMYLREIHFDRKISFTVELSRTTIHLQPDHWQNKVIPMWCCSYTIPNSTNAFLLHCSPTKWDYNTEALKWFSRNNIHLKEVGAKHWHQWKEMNLSVIFHFCKYSLAAKTMWIQKALLLLINVNTFKSGNSAIWRLLYFKLIKKKKKTTKFYIVDLFSVLYFCLLSCIGKKSYAFANSKNQ